MSEILAIVHLGKVIDKEKNQAVYHFWQNYGGSYFKRPAYWDTDNIIKRIDNVSDCIVVDEFNKHQYPEYLI
jgi:hypothetical protein